jgi:hypothetical protein
MNSETKKFIQVEMDETNYQMMIKCMDAYIKTRNKARDRQRTDDTRKQLRAMEEIQFNFKKIKEYDMVQTTTLAPVS